jgi:hypothetical protein
VVIGDQHPSLTVSMVNFAGVFVGIVAVSRLSISPQVGHPLCL